MKTHSTGHDVSTCSTPNTHVMIGKLLRQLGELNHSSYNSNSTTTNTQQIADSTFSCFNYNCSSWNIILGTSIRDQLNNGHLILIRGTRTGGHGHAWVLDGYKTRTTTIRKMARTATSGWFFTGEITTLTDHFMHFNWGWYGDCDGYFAENVYDSSLAFSYDTGVHTNNYNYNIDVKYMSVYH